MIVIRKALAERLFKDLSLRKKEFGYLNIGCHNGNGLSSFVEFKYTKQELMAIMAEEDTEKDIKDREHLEMCDNLRTDIYRFKF